MGYWESDPLLYAHDASGALVHVDSVANGSACGCVCPSCKQPLVAKNGGTKLVHHFAHRKGACKWAAETAVLLLVQEILRSEGRMIVSGASYFNLCDLTSYYCSPCGLLEVKEAALIEIEGRQAPALRIDCVDEKGVAGEFVFVVELAARMTEFALAQFVSEGANVLAMDFKSVYAGMREAEGRHFNRGEFFARVQSPDFIRSVLMEEGGSDVLKWLFHPRRDARKAEADELYRSSPEIRRQSADLAYRRAMEDQPQEFKRMRAEKERRMIEERDRVIEAERRAFRDKGVEALLKVQHGARFYVDDCPLLGQADIVADCGVHANLFDKCIFFEGQRYYLIGCTARQNGIGIEGE